MFFRLKAKCGTHQEDDRIYTSGDVVQTKRNLCETFPGKFEKVYDEDDKKDTGSKAPTIDTPSRPSSKDAESEESKQLNSDSVSKGKGSKKKGKKGKKKNSKKYGVNVTEEFPIAEENDLRVYEKEAGNGKWYSIIEMDDEGKKALLKKTRKKDVVNYIEEMLDEEIHDDDDDEEEDD